MKKQSQKRFKSNKYQKVINERFYVAERNGGGLVKSEAWKDSKGKIVKYCLAYINPLVFSGDDGRVLGYDNTHQYHHRHFMGEITPVDDFISYYDLVKRFEEEIKGFIKWE
ncbi:MAG: transcriptional regulator [Deltaproteobacteria bacterium]|nr:transcriptional regulator [Deltaproteobacteria bacterium]